MVFFSKSGGLLRFAYAAMWYPDGTLFHESMTAMCNKSENDYVLLNCDDVPVLWFMVQSCCSG